MHEPTSATFKSIDGHRDDLARVRGTTRNAVDQLMVGNAKDPYAPFRRFYQEQVLANCDIRHYLDDLEGIRLSATPGEIDLTAELTTKFEKDANLSQAVLDAATDGMTLAEARRLLDACAALEMTTAKLRVEALKILTPREAAQFAVNGSQKVASIGGRG